MSTIWRANNFFRTLVPFLFNSVQLKLVPRRTLERLFIFYPILITHKCVNLDLETRQFQLPQSVQELFRFSEGKKFPGLWTFKNGVPFHGNWGSNFLWFISVSRKIIWSTHRPTVRQPRSRSSCLQERLLVWLKMNQQWFAEHASQLVLFDLVSLSPK